MATARAHTNIALVKYWGKADTALNLPAVGSLSLTLDAFWTETHVARAKADRFVLDGEPDSAAGARAFALLDQMVPGRPPLVVESVNRVPTASGLASSASGMMALVLAAERALDLSLDDTERAEWARRGSGSAARSLFGGFVRLDRSPFGVRTIATSLDVALVVARCARGKKAVSSTVGMTRTQESSPFFAPWVAHHSADLDAAENALTQGDFTALGAVTERSTLRMHASALGADPPLWYWNSTTWAVIEAVRDDGRGHFTMDAGPHVKVLARNEDAPAIKRLLENVDGVVDVVVARPGPAPEVTA